MVKKQTSSVNALFQEAVESLSSPLTHQQISEEMVCTLAAFRAALRDPASSAFRKAPGGWEVTVRRLLEARAAHFSKLAARIRAATDN